MLAPLLSFVGLGGGKITETLTKGLIVILTLGAIGLALWFGVRYIEKKDEAIRLLIENNTKLEEVVASSKAEIEKARADLDAINRELNVIAKAKAEADQRLITLRRQLAARNLTNERNTNSQGALPELNDTINRMFDIRN